jgi:thioesterase domain-containing protein
MNDTVAADLQVKIHRSIPQSAAMGYEIVELDSTHIVVEAPLKPNINIHGTGFAGSIYSLGILGAWAMCHHVIDEAGLDAELVIAKASICYRAPIRGTIRCRCRLNAHQIQSFVAVLRTQERARMQVEVDIGEGPAAQIHATLHASCT